MQRWGVISGPPRTLSCQAPEHPGLCHLYIHCMEMSPYPEKALEVCSRLRHIVPDAGHLRHMPTHIYVQVPVPQHPPAHH